MKNAGFIVVVALIIAALFILRGNQLALVGFDTLGCNSMMVTSSNPLLAGEVVVCNAVANGGGKHWEGTLTSEQIYALTGKYRSISRYKIEADLAKSNCRWSIQEEGTRIASWTWGSYGSICDARSGASDAQSASCGGLFRDINSGGCSPFYQLTCAANAPTHAGAGLLSTTFFDWAVNVKITDLNTGEVFYSQQINPQQKTVSIGNIGIVNFLGNFVGDSLCAAPYTNTKFIRPVGSNAYQAVDVAAYNAYRYAAQPSNIAGIDALNTLYAALLKSSAPYDPYNTYSIVGTDYIAQPNQPVVLPAFQLILKTDALKLYIPQGKPQITNAAAPPLSAGRVAKIEVRVKNVGTDADSFDVRGTSPSGCSALTFRSQRISLSVGQEGSVTLDAEGTGGIQTAEISANSVNWPANVDKTSVRTTVLPYNDATPKFGQTATLTEYGWVAGCSSYNAQYDSVTCQALPTLPSCATTNGTCFSNSMLAVQSGAVCTGVGRMASASTFYLKYEDGLQAPFVPSGKKWIGAPYCAYACDFGQRSDASGNCAAITDACYAFDYSRKPALATLEPEYVRAPKATATPTPTATVTPTPTATVTPTPTATVTPIVTPQPTATLAPIPSATPKTPSCADLGAGWNFDAQKNGCVQARAPQNRIPILSDIIDVLAALFGNLLKVLGVR